MSVNIRPWIFGLAGFQKNVGRDVVNLADQLEKGIIWKVLEREFALGGVTRVLYVVRGQHKK